MKILLLVSKLPKDPAKSMNYGGLLSALRSRLNGSVELEVAAFTELLFIIDDKTLSIIHTSKGFDLKDFDKVIVRTWGKASEQAIATANYLRYHDIPYVDDSIHDLGAGKYACATLRAIHNLPQPRTIYGPAQSVVDYLNSPEAIISAPFIVKDSKGKKGRNNYLLDTVEEVMNRIKSDKNIEYVIQQFVPNNGDYRLLVLGGKVRIVLERTSSSHSHLNNTSAGAQAKLISVSELPKSLIKDAVKAAEVERLAVAGVDIIVDKDTSKHYILEVNRAPQIGTGAFIEEKLDAYSDFIRDFANQ